MSLGGLAFGEPLQADAPHTLGAGPIEAEADHTAYDTSKRISEQDLSGRLDNANGGSAGNGEEKAVANKLLASDNQLYEALTLLKGINILGMRDKPAPAPAAAATDES